MLKIHKIKKGKFYYFIYYNILWANYSMKTSIFLSYTFSMCSYIKISNATL